MAHTWHFFVAGGVHQVSIRSGADLLALRELDQKLWVALAMPNLGVDVAPETMDMLDADRDGRVRAPDILAAIDWIDATWKDPGTVLEGGDSLPLAAIKDPKVLAAARRVLADLGKPDATTISIADEAAVSKAFAGTKLNGDGIVPADSAEDAGVRTAIEEAIAGVGSKVDRSGKPGLDQALADAFFADVDKRAAWLAAGAAARTLGDATAAAADALAAVRAKLDDFFARCQLAAFEPRAAAALNGQDADFVALAGKSLAAGDDDIARLPLARIEAGRAAPLRGPVNPAWAARLATFASACVAPVLGARDELTADEYATIVAKLAPFEAWRAARPVTRADHLDDARVAALAAGPERAKINALIAADTALEAEYTAIASVAKLLRLQRDFGRVLRNFVNFSDFYAKRDGAFQAGTLYLDGRAFRLVVPVGDAGKHATLAPMSSTYLAYCDITRAGDKKAIAVAVTNGDADNIFVGRNGVFYDRAGLDWDATVTKIVANPISVREAFWAPYKKLVRLIEEQINKRASDAEAESSTKIASAAAHVGSIGTRTAAPAAPAAPPAAGAAPAAAGPKKPVDLSIIAVLSLVITSVVGLVVAVATGLLRMGVWAPLGVLALLLTISGPSMLLAWMKLRQRNLGPLLDANGWAVNTRASVNVSFGAALTHLSALPRGATRSLDDPFADKGRPWKRYVVLAVLLITAASWYAGKLDRWLPKAARSVEILGENAPASRK